MRKHQFRTLSMMVAVMMLAFPVAAQHGIDGNEPVHSAPAAGQALEVESRGSYLNFYWNDERVAMIQLLVKDPEGHLIYDSGEQAGPEAGWEATPVLAGGTVRFELQGWDAEGHLIQRQEGEILPAENEDTPMVVKAFDVPGNYTIGGFLGVGTSSPERAIHIKGSNAVFRMDRSRDTAAFMIVRTDDAGNVLKSFVVGVNAAGPGNGSFVINDLGQALTGSGANRLTIDNTGNAIFGKEVRATGFVNTSSRRFKTNIRPLENALDKVLQMQGVTFEWKDSGLPSMGLIAEDVARVAPEVVVTDEAGDPAGIDYGRVSALLVESVKTQQAEIGQLQKECADLRAELEKEIRQLKAERSAVPERKSADGKK